MTDTLYDHWIYQIIVYLYLLPLIIVQLSFYDGKFSCPSSNGHYSAKNWLTEKIFISVESWDHLLFSRIMSFNCATVFEHINWVEGCQNSSKFCWCIIIIYLIWYGNPTLYYWKSINYWWTMIIPSLQTCRTSCLSYLFHSLFCNFKSLCCQ